MNELYNKKYAKTVKPRYLRDYKKEGLYIVTKDKAVYKVSLKHIKRNYKNVTVTEQGGLYTIRGK